MPDSSAQSKFEQGEINNKLEKFFKERKITLKNPDILTDFSTLIADSSNNPDIKSIAPYVDTMENLLKSIPNPYHKTEFLDYVTNIVPGHKYENLLNGANNGLKEEMIINILKELSLDDSGVMLNLKPSNNEKVFKEKLENIINTHEEGKKNPENKKAISQEIKKELENLDKWCKETAKKDNSHVFKNIGQVIKHSFKALASIGNKEAFKKEQKEAGIHMKAIRHANKNTKQTLEHVRTTINKHRTPLPHSITTPTPPKNISQKSERGISVGR